MLVGLGGPTRANVFSQNAPASSYKLGCLRPLPNLLLGAEHTRTGRRPLDSHSFAYIHATLVTTKLFAVRVILAHRTMAGHMSSQAYNKIVIQWAESGSKRLGRTTPSWPILVHRQVTIPSCPTTS